MKTWEKQLEVVEGWDRKEEPPLNVFTKRGLNIPIPGAEVWREVPCGESLAIWWL